MSLIVALLLALVAFVVMAFVLKSPRHARTAIAAALLVGLAGYAMQANPDIPGAPKESVEPAAIDPAAVVAERQAMSGRPGIPDNKWMVIGDALARNGQFADAAAMMLGAVRKDSGNAEAWLSLGNALVAHAEGLLTPAALYAYQQAATAEPDHPGPPFFLGLALAQSGRFGEARQLWMELLARAPDGAPWREDLQFRLNRLDALIAQQQAAGQGGR